ncbi:hypothetical protein D3C80_1396610 [compost metagenome]
MKISHGGIDLDIHFAPGKRTCQNVHDILATLNNLFYRDPSYPAFVRRLPTALWMEKGSIQLNGIATILLLGATHDLRPARCHIFDVIKTLCHGCSPLNHDSIFIT